MNDTISVRRTVSINQLVS